MQKLNTWIRKAPVWIAIIVVLALQTANCFSNIAVKNQLSSVESQIKDVRAMATEANSKSDKAVDDKLQGITKEIEDLKNQNQTYDDSLQRIEQKLGKLNYYGDFQ